MHSKNNSLFIFLSILISLLLSSCSSHLNFQTLLNQPITELGNYKQCRKFIKSGVTVVYLTGTPYEIGFAHGRLCKDEILNSNQYFWDAYEKLKSAPDGKWLPLSRSMEKFIPQEYIQEMKGIADGCGLEYEKILFLNTLTTISKHKECFAFSFKQSDSTIITVRQIDIANRILSWKKMILYIIKPLKGYGFAVLLNPGWVSGLKALKTVLSMFSF